MLRTLFSARKLRADDVLDERIRLESISTAIGSIGVMSIACVMYFIFPHDINTIEYLDTWLYIQLLPGGAWLSFIYFHKQRGTTFTRTLWPYLSTLICSYYGLVWGVGWVYFASDVDLEHIKASVIFTITLGGVFTGGVLATLFHLPSLLSFTLCSLFPPLISSIIHTDIFHTWFGLSLCVYMVACMAFALNLHNFLLGTLAQREEKNELAQQLALEKKRVEFEKGRVEQISQEKNRWVAAINHDLRQPLQALRFFQHALFEFSQQNSNAQSSLKHFEEALDVLETRLNSLSNIKRLDEGIPIVQRQCFPLNAVFRRIYQQSYPLAMERGLQLDYVSTVLYVNSDPIQLERILQNLVDNAIQHMGKTGKILFGVRRRGTQLSIEVRDNGVGIPLSEQAAIFREHYQLNKPEPKPHQGSGLGLFIVKVLANTLEHELSLWSEEGKGCVFRLQVPIAEPPLMDSSLFPELIAESLRSSGQSKILVMDDDEQILISLQTLLPVWGYEVITVLAPNPQKILAEHPDIDFIISDYQLSAEQTGLEVIQQLRQLSQRKIPALVLTGNITPELHAQFQQLDIPVTYKPINALQIKKFILAAN